MRFAGVGLLVTGVLVAILGGVSAGEPAGALLALIAGGFMFVAGAVLTAGASVKDAITRRGA